MLPLRTLHIFPSREQRAAFGRGVRSNKKAIPGDRLVVLSKPEPVKEVFTEEPNPNTNLDPKSDPNRKLNPNSNPYPNANPDLKPNTNPNLNPGPNLNPYPHANPV
ncbi:hypothetical protein PoB_003066300 [Plakobranchus ocellatus]|uniref:Uncharacterized protein n=1 Tax=Plakobranchus ocellatus TaxID=259542 RepID=A0AAV4ABN5_9GAST|nr:hypothetical protein PoB_003066300 [Plakobranchus ocellatus]